MTEIAGEYASGKTQLCYTLCVTATLPLNKSGLNGSVIFVDTENTFRSERVHQIAENRGINPDKILQKVFVCKVLNAAQLELVAQNLGKSIEEYDAKLVIVDSIISLHRAEFTGRETLAERQKRLNIMLNLPKEVIQDRLPTMYEQFKRLDGIDISKEKMEVGPTAHYSMGGVVVDINCRTKVMGLFAVGETISQIHGANRLGGNSLLDTVVFGKIVGKEAARFANELKIKREREKEGAGIGLSQPARPSNTNNNDEKDKLDVNGEIFTLKEPIKFRNEIQQLMKQNAGIIREQAKLEEGLKRVLELKNRFYSKDNRIIIDEFKVNSNDNGGASDNTIENIVLTWQIKSSFIACEAMIRSALMRQESRGAHYRSDFPKMDDGRWKVNIYCRNKVAGADRDTLDTEMELFKENVKEIKGPLADFLKQHTKAEHHREFE